MKNKDKYCLFCDIYKKRKGIIYESRLWFARLDLFPIAPGHAEVIPKRHVVSYSDLKKEEWDALQSAIKETIKIIEFTDLKRVYSGFINNPFSEESKSFCEQMLNHIGISKIPDGYNWGINEGEAAGRTIHHVHFHIIPRHVGDVPNPRGGIRSIIPGKRDYKD